MFDKPALERSKNLFTHTELHSCTTWFAICGVAGVTDADLWPGHIQFYLKVVPLSF